jgi:hypothetical protein
MGTVWAADNKHGWHGAANGVHWVTDNADEKATELATRCDRVRVMPFLEGIPCSIHGMVFRNTTIAIRPCEMLVLRRGRQLVYARCATFWDPPAADREQMRDVARRTGEHLRNAIGYRGAFTIDGVMTADGFVPTEINPRFGAGLVVMAHALPELPLYLLNLLALDDDTPDFQPERLEALLVASADAHRIASAGTVVSKTIELTSEAALSCRDGVWRIITAANAADAADTPDAKLTLGPGPAGGFVRLEFDANRTPIGPAVAPRVAAALGVVEAHYQLGLGTLTAADDVRATAPRCS